MKKSKWILVTLLIVSLSGGAYWFFKPIKTMEATPTQTTTVRRGDILISVSAAGTIGPKREIEVKSKASGAILKMHVRDGDWVKKGQLLVELDKTDEATKVRQAELDLLSTQAKLNQAAIRRDEAKRRYEQNLALREEAYISQDDVLKSLSELKLAESDLSIAKAALLNTDEALKNAQLRYADTEIRAPIAGLVLAKLVEEGQLIASGISATSGGTPLLTIGDMSMVISSAEIDEVDIGKVAIGQSASVQVDAYGERQFEGTLTHIAPKGTDKSNVTVFGIEISINDRKKDLLKAGMTNTATIVVIKKDNVLIVPATSVHRERSSGEKKDPKTTQKQLANRAKTEASQSKTTHYVWIKTGEGRIKQPVIIGSTDYENTEIISGLKEGDLIETPTSDSKKMRQTGAGGQDRNTMRAMRSLGGR
jgi:HlyD family secretion protein